MVGRGARVGLVVVVLGLVCAASCRTPTDLTLRITTDIPCTDVGSTTVTVGRPGELETAPLTTSTTSCDNGFIGTLVVIPSGSDDDTVAMKVVSGYQRRAEQCAAPDYTGCVVARRSLHYIAHRELTVLVDMARDCVDVPCSSNETCVGAHCVQAVIPDPSACDSPQGCGENALDGGASVDGASELDAGDSTAPGVTDARDATPTTDTTITDGGTDATITDGGTDAIVDASGLDGGACTGSADCIGRTVADCVGGQLVPRAGGPCPVACSAGACVTVQTIAAGRGHTCATLSDGSIRCWGDNTSLQLGAASAPNPSPAPVVAGSTIPRVAGNAVVAGGDVTCNVRATGLVECWGANDQGQLAVAPGTLAASATPQVIPGLTLAAPGAKLLPTLAIGGGHACAANTDGGVLCWGKNTSSEIGSTAASPVIVPTRVAGIPGAGTSVAAGEAHSCAADSTSVYCWGDNTYNELAKGFGRDGGTYATPQDLTIANPSFVFSGAYHACVLQTNQKAYCWGLNTDGQCGTGTPTPNDPVPTGIKGVSATCPVSLALGRAHSCMLNDVTCTAHAGEVDCAGANDAGQLGNGTTTDNPQFGAAQVGTLGKAIWLSVGAAHTCVVLDTNGGSAACWGANDRGQLGRGSVGGAFTTADFVAF